MKKNTISRRNFLKLSVAGAGALLVGDTIASTLTATAADDEKKMPVRTLGRTGIEVPILSMGVMRADNPNLVRAAYNSGLFHYDTAHGYQKGKNEEMLGGFFEGKPRESFNIATKVKSRYPWSDAMEQELFDRCDLSLKRLRMDYVDIFYAHDLRSPEEVKDERLIAAMKKIQADGKTKYLGFSYHVDNPAMLDAAIEAGVWDVILLSYNFKLKNLPELDAAMERAAKAGIGLVVMKSMAGGTEDSDGKKKVNAQACLKWVWQNPHIATIIPGFSNYDEFDECLAAVADPTINTDEQQYLASLRNEEGLYCRQCNQCAGQCPHGVPVPEAMRAYMYAYGYKYAGLSKETLAEAGLKADACAGCTECSVHCAAGFDVGRKIASIAPVINVPDQFLA